MTGTAKDPVAHLVSLGLSHDTADAGLCAQVFADEPDPAALYRRLRESSLTEVLALVTCERLAVFAIARQPDTARILLEVLAAETGVPATILRGQVRPRQGEEALAHLFALAAALESQVVGEPQILGQIKESHRQAAALGLAGPGLEPMLQAAYGAAKRVRNETDIGRYPVSIAASGLLVARDVHGDPRRCNALLIGLGEMGEFMAAEIKAAGARGIVVMHPAAARAQAAAHRLGCHFRPWEELEDALAGAEIVVGALGAGRFSVTRPLAERALRARRRAPIYFIDLAVPPDIEPAINDLDGAFVYDLVDLERIALRGRASRGSALEAARAIVAEELANFTRRHAAREATPSIVALRRHFETLRAEVLAGGGVGADEATRRLVNRLLHDPTMAIRSAAADRPKGGDRAGPGDAPGDMPALEAALKRLFRLDGAGAKAATDHDPAEGDDT